MRKTVKDETTPAEKCGIGIEKNNKWLEFKDSYKGKEIHKSGINCR